MSQPPPDARSRLDLADWRRRVADVYRQVREAGDPRDGWDLWRAARDELFRAHAQSPILPENRGAFAGLRYFDHDPAVRVLADVEDAEPTPLDIPTSDGQTMRFTRFGIARFELSGRPQSLELYWLAGYAGGIFLSFRDATSGTETYGACRYLLDTAKGADLGTEDGRLVLDFNFAFNPSCSYDACWVCPLAPQANRLEVPVRAGERI